MRFVLAFFRFWYDFIVGDDWRVAFGVVASLALGVLLLALDVDEGLVTILCAVAIGGSLWLSLRRELRRARG